MGFAPAVKDKSKARVVLCGPSGAGKSFTALAIAHGMSDRIAVLDTENGSARKYAGLLVDGVRLAFDVDEVKAPYTAKRLIHGIRDAESAGYGVLIIDSLTHFWKGIGGVMDFVDETADRMAARGGKRDGFAAWKEGDRVYREYTDAILQSSIHIIATLRTKQTHEKGEDKKIVKLGLQPEYRDGGEYEFDLEGVIDMGHTLAVGKSRIHRADGSTLDGAIIRRPGLAMGRSILAWCEDGTTKAAPFAAPPAVEAPAVRPQNEALAAAPPAPVPPAAAPPGDAEQRAEEAMRLEREALAAAPPAPPLATAEQNLAAAKTGPGTLADRFAAARSVLELGEIAASAKSAPPAEREAAKPAYRAAKARLEAAAGVAA